MPFLSSVVNPLPPQEKEDNSSGMYTQSYTSFSGSDIRVSVLMPGVDDAPPISKELGNLQTISYSIFREKSPVRALGFVGERGRTRGSRTIAGSMVFTVFDRHVLYDLLRRHPGDPNTNRVVPKDIADLSYLMVDQIPPFDVIINFANEYGAISQMAILGLDLAAEGQVMSVQDLLTENTVQYTASHLSLMVPGGQIPNSTTSPILDQPRSFRSILNGANSEHLKTAIRKTRNPYL